MRVTMKCLSILFLGSIFQNLPLNANSRLTTKRGRRTFGLMRISITILFLLASAVLPSVTQAQAPVFVITPEDSSIKFFVKASVALEGTFDKWDATLKFTTPEVETGVLEIKIQADSVNTG